MTGNDVIIGQALVIADQHHRIEQLQQKVEELQAALAMQHRTDAP